MKTERNALTAYLMLSFVMLVWAGNAIVGRAVRADVPPLTLAFVRWAGASLLLLPFAAKTLLHERAAILRGWRPILALGLTGVCAFNALLYTGLRETPASNALLLQAAIPMLVMLLDRIAFGARSGGWRVAGILLSTLGVVVIVFQGDPARVITLQLGGGDTIILAAVVAWSVYTVLLRLRPDISALSFLAVTFLIGVIVMAPLALWEATHGGTVRMSAGVIGAFAYVCVLPSLIAYLLFNAAVARIGPASAGQAITLMPLFGALLSVLLLGEKLHGYHAAGMTLILGGILLSLLGSRKTGRQDFAGTDAAAPLEQRP